MEKVVLPQFTDGALADSSFKQEFMQAIILLFEQLGIRLNHSEERVSWHTSDRCPGTLYRLLCGWDYDAFSLYWIEGQDITSSRSSTSRWPYGSALKSIRLFRDRAGAGLILTCRDTPPNDGRIHRENSLVTIERWPALGRLLTAAALPSESLERARSSLPIQMDPTRFEEVCHFLARLQLHAEHKLREISAGPDR